MEHQPHPGPSAWWTPRDTPDGYCPDEDELAGELVTLVGKRIELHPATDAWMRGDRYGDVTRVGRKYVYVRMDRSGRTLKVAFDNIGRIL